MGILKNIVTAIHESALLHHANRDRDAKQRPQAELTTLQEQAVAHASAGRFEAAIGCYDMILAVDPGSVRSWNCKANALFTLGRFEEALACYERAIAIAPNDPRIWNNKGLTQDMLGYPMDALKSFDAAIALDSGIERVWQNKGQTLSRLGWVEESRRCMKQAQDLRSKRDAAAAT
jgi:tetratricopeptide (TPR) repeat protein